ncbi:putative dehydrogenase [Devosia sp. UYZn731]|uniref:Gfo/Idh/MocA family protein n=1 Tax=Devosia sp. UYZn731 TaxID=3156345 RepID=UPI00339AC677
MSDKKFRVGIIGADTHASWAGASHIPALQAQPGLVLAAVATRREQSAKAAAEAFGAAQWFADPYAMIADETIDVITVAVKVPAHKDLVLAALAAGKAVYSESPLGATVAETEEMATAAKGLHTAIGLQGRHILPPAALPKWWRPESSGGCYRPALAQPRSAMVRNLPALTTISTSWLLAPAS